MRITEFSVLVTSVIGWSGISRGTTSTLKRWLRRLTRLRLNRAVTCFALAFLAAGVSAKLTLERPRNLATSRLLRLPVATSRKFANFQPGLAALLILI